MSARTAVEGKRRVARKHRPAWFRYLKIALWVVVMPIMIGGIAFLAILQNERAKASTELQKFIDTSRELQAKPTEIVAADGKVLYRVSDELREYAPLTEIPQRVQNAMIAAEDVRFWHHPGVDAWALARTLLTDVRERRAAQGGSTITMQLCKLVSSNGEKTMSRKVHDMALALELEKSESKSQILEMYLNKVYFGNHAYGVKAAADVYFDKPLDRLTVGEAAFLVRLVRRPSSWNNLHRKENLERAISNRNDVLEIMRKERMITDAEFRAAESEEPKLNAHPPRTSAMVVSAPFFVDHVLSIVRKELPDERIESGGYRIETTLDPEMQKLAEKEVQRVVRENRKNKVSTAAFVLMNTDGQILAEVGGVDYSKNQFNVIYQGLGRQPGSSFKPFVYATALAQGVVHIDDQLPNEIITYPAEPGGRAYAPKNSDGKYSPTTPLRNAFALSKNVPAVWVIHKTGPQNVVRAAHDCFGFVSPLYAGLPLGIGSSAVHPIEMAQGISVFALKGDRATPYSIKRIIGPEGDIKKDYSPRIVRNVFDPNVCSQIDELMRGVIQFGTGYKANVVPNARGKTGTTNENRDAWFVGYSDGLIGVGWIANESKDKSGTHYNPMAHSVYGGTVTVQFWASIMKAAHDKYGTKFAEAHKTDSKPGTQAPPLSKDDLDLDSMDAGGGTPMGPLPDDAKKAQDKGKAPDMKQTVPPADSTNPDDNPMGDEPATTDKPDKPVKPAPPPPDEYVDVEVCTATGLRAGIYCPETITRRFKKGREPKKICTLHSG